MAKIIRLDGRIQTLPVHEAHKNIDGVTVAVVCLRKKHIAVVRVKNNSYKEMEAVKAA